MSLLYLAEVIVADNPLDWLRFIGDALLFIGDVIGFTVNVIWSVAEFIIVFLRFIADLIAIVSDFPIVSSFLTFGLSIFALYVVKAIFGR